MLAGGKSWSASWDVSFPHKGSAYFSRFHRNKDAAISGERRWNERLKVVVSGWHIWIRSFKKDISTDARLPIA